jgi:hypothetical protein
MDDDLKDVQPYPVRPYPVEPCPVEVWPETSPVVGRSSSGEQLYPYPYLGPYQVAVVLGEGKLAKTEAALTSGTNTRGAPGGAASEGRQRSRPRHPRCQVRFPPLRVSGIRVSDQGSEKLLNLGVVAG